MSIRTAARTGAIFAALLVLLSPSRAAAQVEVEIDPAAYALNGFSLHVARVFGPTRLNVGTFGIDVPRVFHGNDGWRSRMRGAGVKWDYLGSNPDGFFVGAESQYMRMEYTLRASGERRKRDAPGIGPVGFCGSGGSRIRAGPWEQASGET
jgi:hypothetical protein